MPSKADKQKGEDRLRVWALQAGRIGHDATYGPHPSSFIVARRLEESAWGVKATVPYVDTEEGEALLRVVPKNWLGVRPPEATFMFRNGVLTAADIPVPNEFFNLALANIEQFHDVKVFSTHPHGGWTDIHLEGGSPETIGRLLGRVWRT